MQQFIQWGGLTPEQQKAQRDQQILLEEHYLLKKLNEARQLNAAMVAAVGGTQVSGDTITFTVDTSDGPSFAMSFDTNGPIEFTIDWGDGTTHVDDGAGGYYSETHDYPDSNEVYTASIQFNDPTTVYGLNFSGND